MELSSSTVSVTQAALHRAATPSYAYDGTATCLEPGRLFAHLQREGPDDQPHSRRRLGDYSYADANHTERVTVGSRTLAWSMLGLAEESSAGGTFSTNDPTRATLAERVTKLRLHYYFLYDGLGSVVGVMDANGSVGNTYSYDAFGNTTQGGSSQVNSNLRFAGGYHEPAPHNLYQFGTRSYDPTIGRWTQEDPIAGSIDGPTDLDPYVYVGDDPVNLVDPSGACWDIFCHPLRASRHAQDWYLKHIANPLARAARIARSGLGRCAIGAAIGAAAGAYVTHTWQGAVAVGVVGCDIGVTRARAPISPE